MPAPPLLEAINRNSLAVFLLVRFVSPFSPPLNRKCIYKLNYVYMGIGCGTAGERGDGRGESVDTDNVCLERACIVRVGSVCVWHVCVRVGHTGATGVEIVR